MAKPIRKEKRSDPYLICLVCFMASPMTKAPISSENESQETTHANTTPKTSIKQRLRTDLGRSVGVAVIQLLKLNWFTGSQPSHLSQKMCTQLDTQCQKIKFF